MTGPSAPGYSGVRARNDALIRKALQGSVFIAPSTADVLTQALLFSPTTGQLCVLPEGYTDLGWMDDAGFKIDRSIKTSDVKPFGATSPVRTDVTDDETTVAITCLETTLTTLGLFPGFEPSAVTPTADAGGSIFLPKPVLPPTLYYRVLVVAVDEDPVNGEFILGRFFPKAAVTDIDTQTLTDGDAPISYGVTLTSYVDDTAGYAEAFVMGGAGWLADITAEGATVGS
jgi:hypothetical protein